MTNIEDIFKGIISLIFFIIFIGAIIPLVAESFIGSFSFVIGIAFFAIILAILIKILNEFGIGNGI